MTWGCGDESAAAQPRLACVCAYVRERAKGCMCRYEGK